MSLPENDINDLYVCLGIANLSFFRVWKILLLPSNHYHMKILPAALEFAVTLGDITVVALVMYAILMISKRWGGEAGRHFVALVYFLFLFMLLILIAHEF